MVFGTFIGFVSKRIEGLITEDKFGFRRGKSIKHAIFTLRQVIEIQIKKTTFIAFVNIGKVFDNMKWKKMF